MIYKRIKDWLTEFRQRLDSIKTQNIEIKNQLAELEWAHIFHDSIRGTSWSNSISISPGRWAGNYSFFYILGRILIDYKPKSIIEFGLGESSKFVSTVIKNDLPECRHLIVEQDENWSNLFRQRFTLNEQSVILHLPLVLNKVHDFEVRSYEGIKEKIKTIFDLYIIDGPFGSARYSRYDICLLAEQLTERNEFIIIIDDYERQGEKDTADELIRLLKEKKIEIYLGYYRGNKAQIVIATEQYRFVTSL